MERRLKRRLNRAWIDLNAQWFMILDDAQSKMEDYSRHYGGEISYFGLEYGVPDAVA
jgi:hypothetical protein